MRFKDYVSEATYVPFKVSKESFEALGQAILDEMGLAKKKGKEIFVSLDSSKMHDPNRRNRPSITMFIDMEGEDAPYGSEEYKHFDFMYGLLWEVLPKMIEKYVGCPVTDISLTFPTDYKEGSIMLYFDVMPWVKK